MSISVSKAQIYSGSIRKLHKNKLNAKQTFTKYICVTLINFLPIMKQVSQFLIRGKLFLEREKERYMLAFQSSKSHIVYLLIFKVE